MKTVTTIKELRGIHAQLSEPVGLVPTMGYLHEGHLSLVRYAQSECASVVVSIFVNPTQFGPQEDLGAYPRDIHRDLTLLEAEGVDVVWMPSPQIMYPEGFQTWVNVDQITRVLEGAKRLAHFRGVTTIVAKLFNSVLPQKAYFGQKDAQQAIVIQQMVRDLNFPIDVVVCPIVREPDGLALSSRNTYLSQEERQAALVLYKALCAAKNAYDNGVREANHLRDIMTQIINDEPLANFQYVSCAHPTTLIELDGLMDSALLSMAVQVGKTRLIDNLLLNNKPAK